MSEQRQIRLGEENLILSHAKVRRLAPDDLGISSSGEPKEQLTESEQAEGLRTAAVEAATAGVGAAVLTLENRVYTGSPVDGDGWGVHALELAVSQAVSEGADAISEVAVYAEDGQSGLCGRCLQAVEDYRDEDVMVQVVAGEDSVSGFKFNELYPAPWLS